MENTQEKLWVEKYRPQKLSDCILPTELKKSFTEIIKSGSFTHLLFCGTAGTGKTTIARVLCNELNLDYMFINASEQNSIDVLRTQIMSYASSMSLEGKDKVVILDEADNLRDSSFQPALRGVMEQFSKNCRFILTVNFKNKLIQPLWSRCSVVDFHIDKAEKVPIMSHIFNRLVYICQQEKIVVKDKAVLAKLVNKYFPDIRRMINELQSYSASGEIDAGILETLSEASFKELAKILKEKRFMDLRKWVASNGDGEPTGIFRAVYDNLIDVLDAKSVPQFILVLADYQYKSAFVADQQLNFLAMLTELMANVTFKG